MTTSSDAGSDRIAVLIDADNTSHRYAEALLNEVALKGNPTILRAYGDWSSDHLKGWQRQLNLRGIRPIHQVAWSKGKNATDFAMVIDAMDILYSDNVEGFALVASDSDYTGLAQRLREAGKKVYGFGRQSTGAALQNSCDEFIHLDVLDEANEAETGAEDGESAPSINLPSALTRAVNAQSDDEGWARLASLGQHLKRTHPSFDPRQFGHSRLTDLVVKQPYLVTKGAGNDLQVRLKGSKPAAKRTTARSSTAKKP